MIDLTLKVTYLDGRTMEADLATRDMVAFERTYNLPATVIARGAHVEHLLFMAWTALRRTNQETLEFDPFIDAVRSIEPVARDAAPLDERASPA